MLEDSLRRHLYQLGLLLLGLGLAALSQKTVLVHSGGQIENTPIVAVYPMFHFKMFGAAVVV